MHAGTEILRYFYPTYARASLAASRALDVVELSSTFSGTSSIASSVYITLDSEIDLGFGKIVLGLLAHIRDVIPRQLGAGAPAYV